MFCANFKTAKCSTVKFLNRLWTDLMYIFYNAEYATTAYFEWVILCKKNWQTYDWSSLMKEIPIFVGTDFVVVLFFSFLSSCLPTLRDCSIHWILAEVCFSSSSCYFRRTLIFMHSLSNTHIPMTNGRRNQSVCLPFYSQWGVEVMSRSGSRCTEIKSSLRLSCILCH